nr:hypothetical protein [Tanacetum cinerariifolium]
MLEVREVDAEEEVQVPAQDDVVQENVTEDITDDVAQPTSPLPPSPIIPSSPPHQLPRPPLLQAAEGLSLLVQQVLDKCSGRISGDMDEGIELVVNQEKDAEIEGRQADTRAEIYNIDLDHSSKVLSTQEHDAEVQEAIEIITTAKLMTEVVTAAATQVVAASNPKPAAKPKSINETPAQKAAKRRRLCEQAKEDEDLKKQLEVVVDEDDDVFIEATPIGRKVPIVSYEIVMINNKPREDLEDLWKIMKLRFFTSKPTNFSDDYLLATLKIMFEKTDAQDVIWRSQHTEYGQALVEEESEMSLELLRFTRQQLLEYQQG